VTPQRIVADDYLEECRQLYALLRGQPAARWDDVTQFKDWTINDVIGHLHLFDYAAGLTLDSADALRRFFAQTRAGRDAGRTLVDFTRAWLGDERGSALLEHWHDYAQGLAARYRAEDPRRRVAWGGPDMSVRSCISGRQMETWAHAQAVFDLLGVERQESDRLYNVALMGVATFGWSYTTRALAVPPQRPGVYLTAPSGAAWTWPAEDAANRIDGTAVDFCRVVAQTRNVADTALAVRGEVARQWMSIAQCFAGPPEQPPAPGTRFRQPH
jgi:uncharacterized protein (TIGR03084 family)